MLMGAAVPLLFLITVRVINWLHPKLIKQPWCLWHLCTIGAVGLLWMLLMEALS
jgi:hypothetical protein